MIIDMRDINDYTKSYQSLPFENIQVQYRRKKVIELLDQYKHDSILEVGCGMEPLFQFYHDYQCMTIVEPSDIFCKNARELSDTYDKKIYIVNGNVEKKTKELQNRHYDYIIISSLLHELEDPCRVLEEIGKLCIGDEVIHVNVPNAYSLHRILAYEAGLIPDLYAKSQQQKKMQQNSTFDLQSITELAEKAGFKVIAEGTYFPKVFTHGQMQTLMDMNILNERLLDGFYQMEKYLPQFGSELYVQLQRNGERMFSE